MTSLRETESCGGLLGDGQERAAERRDFRLPGTPVRWPPDRIADIRHVRLELRVDPEKKTLRGVATHRLAPIGKPAKALFFDLRELAVDGVRGNHRELKFRHEGGVLEIVFDRPQPPDREIEVAISYHGSPRTGLNFIGPDRDYPDRPYQAWTQGQDEYARYWFPGHDYPNQRSTTELIVAAPAKYQTVSNGRLVSVKRRGRDRVWHWLQEVPHVAYLVTLVVGQFDTWEDEVAGVPLQYLVPPGRRAEGERAFGHTPEMLSVMADFAGQPYPYARYAQVVVHDFIWGGMENTSATTYTDDMLPDERALLDYDPSRLVSHELAHQWFGDLITCREWAHGWLNEGFATYAHALWVEKSRGLDEAQAIHLNHAEQYFEEDARYRRPIVCRTYNDPFELFDIHLYEKAAWVLWMLRFVVGDQLFGRVIHEYVGRHRGGLVATEDLVRVFEDVTGKSLGWFFDQWIYGAGHPEFEVKYSWDDDARTAHLSVQQKQRVDQVTRLFRMPVRVAFGQPAGRPPVIREIEVGAGTDATDGFSFALRARPTWVRFDHGNRVLKTLDFDRAEELLLAQLTEDEVTGRVEAARDLGRKATVRAVEALAKTLQGDSFWAVQAAAAKALGEAFTGPARDALLRGLQHPNSKVRTVVAGALGAWRDDAEVGAALIRTLTRDRSYYTAGAAARALGQVRVPNAAAALAKALTVESFQDVVAQQALAGLATLRQAEQLPVIVERARPGLRWRVRSAAIVEAARLARDLAPESRVAVRELAERSLRDPLYFVRRAGIWALATLGDPGAIGALRAAIERDPESGIRYQSRVAVEQLSHGKSREDEIGQLREDLERLRKSSSELRDRVGKLETRGGRASGRK